MGPIRVQNFGAFGQNFLVPRSVQPRPRTLGAPPGPTISQAELDYQQARTQLEGVRNQYQNLVSLLGESRARQSLEEAGESYDRAYAAYLATLPGRTL